MRRGIPTWALAAGIVIASTARVQAGIVAFGDPVRGGSWGNWFSWASSPGEPELTEIEVYWLDPMSEGFRVPAFTHFSLAGWADNTTGSTPVHYANASGPATMNLDFVLWFSPPTPGSTGFQFDIVARSNRVLIGAWEFEWTGTQWAVTSGKPSSRRYATIDNSPELPTIFLLGITGALGGPGALLRRRRRGKSR